MNVPKIVVRHMVDKCCRISHVRRYPDPNNPEHDQNAEVFTNYSMRVEGHPTYVSWTQNGEPDPKYPVGRVCMLKGYTVVPDAKDPRYYKLAESSFLEPAALIPIAQRHEDGSITKEPNVVIVEPENALT